MDAARAPARAARPRRARPLDAADRADGRGKTLAGFLPSLVDLETRGDAGDGSRRRLHTLYVSPLKALAVDVARNVETPVAEMGLPVRIETRTGDTSASKRARQFARPPDILLTTPEQVALMVSHRDARELLSGVRRIVLDEIHSLVTSKRGDLLALGLARLRRLAPEASVVGLSATVREPDALRRYIASGSQHETADLVVVEGGARPTSASSASGRACRSPATRRAMRWARSTPRSRRTGPRSSS